MVLNMEFSACYSVDGRVWYNWVNYKDTGIHHTHTRACSWCRLLFECTRCYWMRWKVIITAVSPVSSCPEPCMDGLVASDYNTYRHSYTCTASQTRCRHDCSAATHIFIKASKFIQTRRVASIHKNTTAI